MVIGKVIIPFLWFESFTIETTHQSLKFIEDPCLLKMYSDLILANPPFMVA